MGPARAPILARFRDTRVRCRNNGCGVAAKRWRAAAAAPMSKRTRLRALGPRSPAPHLRLDHAVRARRTQSELEGGTVRTGWMAQSGARTVPPNLSESCQVTRPLRSRTVRLPGTPPCRTEPVRTVPSNPSSQSRSEYGVPVRRDPLRREAHGTGRPAEPRVAEHPRRRLLDTPQVTPNDT